MKRRWLKWVLEEADNLQVVLPWERGANKAAWHQHLESEQDQKVPARAG